MVEVREVRRGGRRGHAPDATRPTVPASGSHLLTWTIRPGRAHETPDVRIRHFIIVIGAAALVVGATLVATHHHARFRNSPTASVTLDQIDPNARNELRPGALDPAPAAVLPPAATPEAAVRGLLDSFIAGDAARSFSLLSATDRAASGPLASWLAELTSRPHYLRYQVVRLQGTSVETDVTIEPRLDEVVGYIPARATVTWPTTLEDGGYRVSLSAAVSEPVLPDDQSAPTAAEAWVTARENCQPGATYPGTLLGQPTFADALCHSSGAYRAKTASGLDTFGNPTLLLEAFGPDAPAFVRVVRMDGPTPFDVAVAPLGDDWQVVGVMEA
jgi:hypothetical protein